MKWVEGEETNRGGYVKRIQDIEYEVVRHSKWEVIADM